MTLDTQLSQKKDHSKYTSLLVGFVGGQNL